MKVSPSYSNSPCWNCGYSDETSLLINSNIQKKEKLMGFFSTISSPIVKLFFIQVKVDVRENKSWYATKETRNISRGAYISEKNSPLCFHSHFHPKLAFCWYVYDGLSYRWDIHYVPNVKKILLYVTLNCLSV